jgi:CheY-like chemotaxis protein
MVIDDREIDCYISEHILRKNNFAAEIVIKISVDSALEYLRAIDDPEQFPGVIFLDIRMPEKDGFDFLDEYLQLPENMKNVCDIVMYSTAQLPEDAIRRKNYPIIRHFFIKPMSKDKLEEVKIILRRAA